jgi:hypothetical protein
MFRLIIIASVLVLELASAPVVAQTESQPADQAPSSSSGASSPPAQSAPTPEDRRSAAKALVAQCIAAAKEKGLRGDARKDAINNCIAAQRPDLAARRECFQKGKAQNLAGDAFKAFVRQCVRQGK